MRYLEELIENELRKIENSDLREKLKEDREKFYKDFIDDIISGLKGIENIVFQSLQKSKEYPIYTIPIHKDKIKEFEDEFEPVVSQIYKQYILENKTCVIDRVIVTLEHSKLMDLKGKIFHGKKVCKNIEIPFTFTLVLNEEVKEKEEKLYEIVSSNGKEWIPMFSPYKNRVYDVVALNADENILLQNEEEYYEYDFKKYNSDIFKDYVLMWNIKNIIVLSDKLSVNLEENGIYCHMLDENVEGMTFIKSNISNEILDIKQENGKIFIFSHSKIIDNWSLVVIKYIDNIHRFNELKFKLYGNSTKSLLLSGLKNKYRNRIRSEVEIFRVINSLISFQDIELVRIELSDDILEPLDIEDTNSYILDTINNHTNRENLYLYFKYDDNIEFKYERLSYLVSLVQYYFIEYKCIGKRELKYGTK